MKEFLLCRTDKYCKIVEKKLMQNIFFQIEGFQCDRGAQFGILTVSAKQQTTCTEYMQSLKA